ncbi:MAG: Zn-dependent hydrolase [Bacteroidales bacterium]|nr:Zn-dependent hydrolase [Bacteroidales bacterium]
MKRIISLAIVLAVTVMINGCGGQQKESKTYKAKGDIQERLDKYTTFKLTADLSEYSEDEKKMLSLLFDAAKLMDDIYWHEAYGDKEELLNSIATEPTRKFATINYGPWDRLANNEPFIKDFKEKPAGANFYPTDMTKQEFENWDNENKTSLYTLIRRDDEGNLKTVWYHEAFAEKVNKAADLLEEAAKYADTEGLANYLKLRAKAFRTDKYQESDFAWMEMKDSKFDVVIGPIENYEDGLFGYKAAHEAFILLKDIEWSKKLSKYAGFLPELQKGLPIETEYKKEMPGSDADLNAYQVIYYAGDCNAGSKTIAINLPNDEEVQLKKGSRKLQLKNAMKAKFDKILVPISNMLIDEEQRQYVKFDAFFSNTMFHEVAHGMGIKNTINDKGTVREALKEQYSAIEEGKADILGLYLVTKLYQMGEYKPDDLMDNYVTFMASIFRSIRFGLSSSHGKANMIRFNYFEETGAFTRQDDGTYKVNFEKMQKAMVDMIQMILHIQGDGDYDRAKALVKEKGVIMEQLQNDLNRLSDANIPVDIVFEQGKDVVGLK